METLLIHRFKWAPPWLPKPTAWGLLTHLSCSKRVRQRAEVHNHSNRHLIMVHDTVCFINSSQVIWMLFVLALVIFEWFQVKCFLSEDSFSDLTNQSSLVWSVNKRIRGLQSLLWGWSPDFHGYSHNMVKALWLVFPKQACPFMFFPSLYLSLIFLSLNLVAKRSTMRHLQKTYRTSR